MPRTDRPAFLETNARCNDLAMIRHREGYAANALAPADAEAFRIHVRTCLACAVALRNARTKATLGGELGLSPDDPRVAARLETVKIAESICLDWRQIAARLPAIRK